MLCVRDDDQTGGEEGRTRGIWGEVGFGQTAMAVKHAEA